MLELNLVMALVLAGVSGWSGDDLCPPPRPWPWPWPWRKLVAVLGGVGCFYLFAGRMGDAHDAVSTLLLGVVGGVALPSLLGGFTGGRGGPST